MTDKLYNEAYMENVLTIVQDYDTYDQLFIVCFLIRQFPELQPTVSYTNWVYKNGDKWPQEIIMLASIDVKKEMDRLQIPNRSRKGYGCAV